MCLPTNQTYIDEPKVYKSVYAIMLKVNLVSVSLMIPYTRQKYPKILVTRRIILLFFLFPNINAIATIAPETTMVCINKITCHLLYS